MFQSFQSETSPETGAPRIAALRGAMAAVGLDGFLVPRADRFQGEYVAPCDARLSWLTGFTGSAGFAAALMDRAGVFVDGRYRVQVKTQVDLQVFTPVDWPEVALADWLREALPEGGRVGFDPMLHTVDEMAKLRAALGDTIALVPGENLVDTIWEDRPAPPTAPVRVHPESFAGQSSAAKRATLAETLAKSGRHAILTQPDSICWLLNIRGGDIERNPVVHAMAILAPDGGVTLFTDAPMGPDVRTHLGGGVTVLPLDGITGYLTDNKSEFQMDPATCPLAIADLTPGATHAPDPCALPKARKNAAEIAGMRAAHLRDGAAMVEFLAWLDAQAPGSLTEIDVVRALEGFRRATNQLEEISFDTISGAGANGAIVHYRVTEASNAPVRAGLLLVDSGGQYLDGTTDITRTVAIGAPPPAAIAPFTRVLKGMVAISRARFPRGVGGAHLDVLARNALWQAGQDYDHGTGHGVGAYLCVHEGPARISRVSTMALEAGMILSNEPGYYREGAFGIRTENLIVVREAAPVAGGDAHRTWLDFETLTFVPIDRRLIDTALLSGDEIAWIDAYHAEVIEKIGSRLSPGARDWLRHAAAPLSL